MKENHINISLPSGTIEAEISSLTKTPGINMMALYNKRMQSDQQKAAPFADR